MMSSPDYSDALYAARCVADHAVRAGILSSRFPDRPVYHHMGAVLADAVLQAGLNYKTVVKPRIETILTMFPHASTVSALIKVIETVGSSALLRWEHSEKIARFDGLVKFVAAARIENNIELREALRDDCFRSGVLNVRGIGPKTVDYMACLVGLDCIAVDRHVRGFAECVGLEDGSYDYLRDVFSFAADLLAIPRREFDSRLWHHQTYEADRQNSSALAR